MDDKKVDELLDLLTDILVDTTQQLFAQAGIELTRGESEIAVANIGMRLQLKKLGKK